MVYCDVATGGATHQQGYNKAIYSLIEDIFKTVGCLQ